MRLRKHIFLALLLIMSAIISGKTDKGISYGDASLQSLSRQDFLRSSCGLQGHAASGQSGTRVEKHHQRTIASEAIIADFAIPHPQFSYCLRNYSLFLPGGCPELSSSPFFLRGPPFCC
jgi:hypothetical protein